MKFSAFRENPGGGADSAPPPTPTPPVQIGLISVHGVSIPVYNCYHQFFVLSSNLIVTVFNCSVFIFCIRFVLFYSYCSFVWVHHVFYMLH